MAVPTPHLPRFTESCRLAGLPVHRGSGEGRGGEAKLWGLSRGHLYLHAYSLLLPELTAPLVAPPPAPFATALSHLFPGGDLLTF